MAVSLNKLSKRASRKKFNSTSNKVRAVNSAPRVKRGGIRA